MRTPLAVAAVTVLAIAASIAGASSTFEGPALIRVTQKIEREYHVGTHVVKTAYLRDRTTRRIGWSTMSCVPLGRGGLLGTEGSRQCTATFRFPLGRLIAIGTVKTNAASYVLAVAGGTSFYNAAGGTLLVRGVGSRVELLLFSLE